MNKIPVCPLETGKLVAVLYSLSQDCFHLETINDYLKTNIQNGLMKRNKNDYRLIGITNSDVEGDTLIQEFQKAQSKFLDYTRDSLINECFKNEDNEPI